MLIINFIFKVFIINIIFDYNSHTIFVLLYYNIKITCLRLLENY